MPAETAYTLSDIYIQKLDKLTTEKSIEELHETLVFDYTNRMKKINQSYIYSKPVVKAMNYIEDHLHEKIMLEDLANYLKLDKTYLCKLFKNETGLTPTQYRNKNYGKHFEDAMF